MFSIESFIILLEISTLNFKNLLLTHTIEFTYGNRLFFNIYRNTGMVRGFVKFRPVLAVVVFAVVITSYVAESVNMVCVL